MKIPFIGSQPVSNDLEFRAVMMEWLIRDFPMIDKRRGEWIVYIVSFVCLMFLRKLYTCIKLNFEDNSYSYILHAGTPKEYYERDLGFDPCC